MNIIEGSDMLRNIPALAAALYDMSKAWSGLEAVWLLGGSCSLLLQQVELKRLPNDIDVYADIAAAKQLHTAAPGTSENRQELNRSGLYTSLLSHYRLRELRLELVGGFEIMTEGSMYRLEVEHVLRRHAPLATLNDIQFCLTPLSHEFMFNMVRERRDRYEAIAQVMNARPELHVPLVSKLLEANVWSDRHLSWIAALLPWAGELIVGPAKYDKGGKRCES
ncbi:hypothetical protein OIN60_07750 [Paenibacillus sp. P96]|uniref:Nucleotidyl transferase AbiEii/AbiGii toxin family protein n=1 Tax=Paenibacillus zeirhizosphaerae TaxID=2987519 RepID=A0ABT9FPL3_9BACL|nr:hypothetical protein [Paenibacillus sp. P96]MDP4096662.1 hypothetical protein [Paenibacillus sp. P96]